MIQPESAIFKKSTFSALSLKKRESCRVAFSTMNSKFGGLLMLAFMLLENILHNFFSKSEKLLKFYPSHTNYLLGMI